MKRITGTHWCSLYKKIGLIALLALGSVSCSKDMSEPSTDIDRVSGPHIMLRASFGEEESSSARAMSLSQDDVYVGESGTTFIKKSHVRDKRWGSPEYYAGWGLGVIQHVRGLDNMRMHFAEGGKEKIYLLFLQGDKRFVSEATLLLKPTDSKGKKYYAELLPVALPAGLDPSSSQEIIMTGAIGVEGIDPATGYIKVKSPGVFRAGDRLPTLPMYFPAQKIEAKHLTGEVAIQANFKFLGGLIIIPMFRELDKRFYPETLDMGLSYEESPFMTEGVIDLLAKDIAMEGWTSTTLLQGGWVHMDNGDIINTERIYGTPAVHTDSVIYQDSYSPRTVSMTNSPKARVTFDLSPLGEMGRESSTAFNSKTPRYTGSVYAMYVYSRPVHELSRDSAWGYTVPPTGLVNVLEANYDAVYPAPAPGNGYWRYFWVARLSGPYSGKPISIYGTYIDGAVRKKFCMLSVTGPDQPYHDQKLRRRIRYGLYYPIFGNQSSLSGRSFGFGSFNPLYKRGTTTIDGTTYDQFFSVKAVRDTTWHPDIPDGFEIVY